MKIFTFKKYKSPTRQHTGTLWGTFKQSNPARLACLQAFVRLVEYGLVENVCRPGTIMTFQSLLTYMCRNPANSDETQVSNDRRII